MLKFFVEVPDPGAVTFWPWIRNAVHWYFDNLYLFQVSKVGVSAFSIIQQRTLDAERPGEDIAVNHVHPG